MKWNSVRKKLNDCVKLNIIGALQNGIKIRVEDQNNELQRGKIGLYMGAFHFVGMQWIKDAYIKCYNRQIRKH